MTTTRRHDRSQSDTPFCRIVASKPILYKELVKVADMQSIIAVQDSRDRVGGHVI